MKKMISLILAMLLCLMMVPSAFALETVDIVGVQAIAEVLQNGMTVTNVRIEYPEEIASITISPGLFQIAGREIVRTYVNNTGEPGDVERQGKYVFLQLRYEDTEWNSDRETWGTAFEGGRNTAVYMPVVIAGKQHTYFQTISGKYAQPASFTNDSERILVVEDFIPMKATDPETGTTIGYQLYVPEGAETEALPLVVFLHGGGERGTDNMAQMVCYRQGLEFAYPDAQAENPCFVMYPQSGPEGWLATLENGNSAPSPSAEAVMAGIQDIIANYNIDTNRIYVTGVSMGGMGSFGLAINYPEVFAAVYSSAFRGTYTEEQFAGLADMPVWLFCGEGDSVGLEPTTDEIAANIEKYTGQTVYRVDGEDCWDCNLRGEAADKLAEDVIAAATAAGTNKMYVKFLGGSIQPDSHHIHMYVYNVDAIRGWLFAQSK